MPRFSIISLTGIIDVIDHQHLDERIVVDEVVEFLSPDQKRADDPALVDGLAIVGDAAPVHQIDDAAREHFRVDTQVLVVCKGRQDGIRNASDTYNKIKTRPP